MEYICETEHLRIRKILKKNPYGHYGIIPTPLWNCNSTADAMWSSRGGVTLSREITDDYARKILACEAAEPIDIQFDYLALQGREAVNRDILVDYLIRKGGRNADDGEWTNHKIRGIGYGTIPEEYETGGARDR